MSKILAFSGSTRAGSFNKKILRAAVAGALNAGAEVTEIDLSDFRLPLYDGDLERYEGIPENAVKLKELFLENQSLLLALPEYNSSMSGVFKNVIDWVSRPSLEGEEPLVCFKYKTAALISASPGNLGGLRGLVHARSMLENLDVLLVPSQVCVPHADTAFGERGVLLDYQITLALEKMGARLATLTDQIQTAQCLEIKRLDRAQIQEFENEGNNPGLQKSFEGWL